MSKKRHVKCIVANCQNHRDEGDFVGALCYSCYHFIAEGVDVLCTSQAFRNALNFVWPLIREHVDQRLTSLLFDFESRPTDLASPERARSLIDSELAALVATTSSTPSPDPEIVAQMVDGHWNVRGGRDQGAAPTTAGWFDFGTPDNYLAGRLLGFHAHLRRGSRVRAFEVVTESRCFVFPESSSSFDKDARTMAAVGSVVLVNNCYKTRILASHLTEVESGANYRATVATSTGGGGARTAKVTLVRATGKKSRRGGR